MHSESGCIGFHAGHNVFRGPKIQASLGLWRLKFFDFSTDPHFRHMHGVETGFQESLYEN